MVAGCITAYQPKGAKGGYDETWLSETVVRVSFHANGFTESHRADQFLLRRCAEIALERGRRYFVVEDRGATSTTDPRPPLGHTNQTVTVRLLDGYTERATDAVVVIDQTDALAEGRLSKEARWTLVELRSRGE